MKTKLSTDEFNGLTKIAEKTKMDCWFAIVHGNDEDWVFDIEEKERLPLDFGITLLSEGIVDNLDTYGLSATELTAVTNLFKSLSISL